MPIPFHQFNGDIAEFFNGVRDVEHEEAGATQKPFVVLAQAENVDYTLILIPVAANTFKDTGAVVQCVGHNADLGLA